MYLNDRSKISELNLLVGNGREQWQGAD
eukprot:SAG25_NODE_11497_length_303_cov_0.637255_1_plen_27_part_01